MKLIKTRIKKYIYISLILSLFILSACSVNTSSDGLAPDSLDKTTPQDGPAQNDAFPPGAKRSEAEELLESMELKEKIGQLFIVRPEALHINPLNKPAGQTETPANNLENEPLKTYPVGGIALFGEDISTPEQLTDFIKDIQRQSKIPLFIGIDEEGGSVSRIGSSPEFDVPRYESMGKIGESGDPENAYHAGVAIGTYLAQYGINLNFAPVADINTNPENIVIGDRSFGDDPDLVAQMVLSNISGLQESEVMSCVKHFPGHGDTKGDTHDGYVSIEKTWEELKEQELIPFIASLHTTDMVMISHITAPNITKDQLPASLSAEMIDGKLRKSLGYKGVVITDAMEMGAITQEYSSSESAVKAILAGNDIILMPGDFEEAFEGIHRAVENGIISEKRIDESVRRILELKEKYDLL
ncbi:MAG: glycoside hydrolase family 3 protein [Anaerovoracaceae bacterium]|jgi:beta-N-acetylhexosaminidase